MTNGSFHKEPRPPKEQALRDAILAVDYHEDKQFLAQRSGAEADWFLEWARLAAKALDAAKDMLDMPVDP